MRSAPLTTPSPITDTLVMQIFVQNYCLVSAMWSLRRHGEHTPGMSWLYYFLHPQALAVWFIFNSVDY